MNQEADDGNKATIRRTDLQLEFSDTPILESKLHNHREMVETSEGIGEHAFDLRVGTNTPLGLRRLVPSQDPIIRPHASPAKNQLDLSLPTGEYSASKPM